MRRALGWVLLLVVAPALADDESRVKATPKMTEWARSWTPQQLHEAVTHLEREPFGEEARRYRTGLMLYLEDVDFVFCVTEQIVALKSSKLKVVHEPIWLQVIFGSGRHVVRDPEADQLAYRMAGWESALRAYEVILTTRPEARREDLDRLLALRKDGRLAEYVKPKLCGG